MLRGFLTLDLKLRIRSVLIHIGVQWLPTFTLVRNFIAVYSTRVRATQGRILERHVHIANDMLPEITKAMLYAVSSR